MTVRAFCKWAIEAKQAGLAVSGRVSPVPCRTCCEECRSVHSAGINERVPSGNTSTRSRLPRRRIHPNTSSVFPANGWHRRTTVT